MSQAQATPESIKELQTQVAALLTLVNSQQQLLTSQLALQAAQATRDAQLDRQVLDNLRLQVVAQASLDKAKAGAPFAELQGIKEALASVAVTGKEGSLTLGKGVDGALLFRVKSELLQSMNELAKNILVALPDAKANYVVGPAKPLQPA
jgi:hypothetical protein